MLRCDGAPQGGALGLSMLLQNQQGIIGSTLDMLSRHSPPAVQEQDVHSFADLGLGWLSGRCSALSLQRTSSAQRQHTS